MYLHFVLNLNLNSLLVKRQIDNPSPGRGVKQNLEMDQDLSRSPRHLLKSSPLSPQVPCYRPFLDDLYTFAEMSCADMPPSPTPAPEKKSNRIEVSRGFGPR